MKKTMLILATLIPGLAFADGEYPHLVCKGTTNDGRAVSLSTCLGSESDVRGDVPVIACGKEKFESVTIRRTTNIAKVTPEMSEVVRIPGQVFRAKYIEDGLTLTLRDSRAGKIFVNVVADDLTHSSMKIQIPAMNHDLAVVSCTLDSF